MNLPLLVLEIIIFLIKYEYFLSAIKTQLSNNAHCTVSAQGLKMVYYSIQCNNLKGNAAYFNSFSIIDENDALSEYNKIPLGHNRTNGAVYSKISFKVEICSAH